MDHQRKDHIDPGGYPQQLQTHNLLTDEWKISTAQIREEIYYSLTRRGLFPEERKGYCKGSKGTGEVLYIDQHILNESRRKS